MASLKMNKSVTDLLDHLSSATYIPAEAEAEVVKARRH